MIQSSLTYLNRVIFAYIFHSHVLDPLWAHVAKPMYYVSLVVSAAYGDGVHYIMEMRQGHKQ